MTFSMIEEAFNRALKYSFVKKKLLCTFLMLVMVGLIFVFFHGIAPLASSWAKLALLLIPYFLSSAILLPAGIVLIRIYHSEIKGKKVVYRDIATKSLDLMMAASYLFLPLTLLFISLWIVLGIFALLQQTSGFGEVIATIFAFFPFLISFFIVVLIIFQFAVFFVATPLAAFLGLDKKPLLNAIVLRVKTSLFSNAFLAILSIIPLVMTIKILIGSYLMMGMTYELKGSMLQHIIELFFVMLPCAALLTPSVIFFFNFSAEAQTIVSKLHPDPQ